MKPICLLVSVLMLPSAAFASSKVSNAVVSESSGLSLLKPISPWSVWGLTEVEWGKYQQVMMGPRKFWSPDATPLSVLGAEASTLSERKRIARLQWRMDLERMEKEVAYQKAYNAVREEWLTFQTAVGSTPQSLPYKRMLYFTSTVKLCDVKCQRLLSGSIPVDVYFVGGVIPDIQRWAARYNINSEKVTSGNITLNISSGQYKPLYSAGIPTVYGLTMNNKIQPVP